MPITAPKGWKAELAWFVYP